MRHKCRCKNYCLLIIFIIKRREKQWVKNWEKGQKKVEHEKKYITIGQLRNELEVLKVRNNPFFCFGFTSNDIGNIYLSQSDKTENASDKFYIQFEPLSEAKFSFIKKLKDYAELRKFPYRIITPIDNRIPENNRAGIELYGLFDMPEIRLEVNTDIPNTLRLLDVILHDIFKNKRDTKYEALFLEEDYLTV